MSVFSKTQTITSTIKPPKDSTLTPFFNEACFELLSSIQFSFDSDEVTVFNSTSGLGCVLTYSEFQELLNYIDLI